jgi:lysozyme
MPPIEPAHPPVIAIGDSSWGEDRHVLPGRPDPAPLVAPAIPEDAGMSSTTLAAIPPAAIYLLHHYESCAKKLPSGRIAPYLDAKGIPTIGWGNTRWEDGRAVKMTDEPIEQARADSLFAAILLGFDRQVREWLPARYHGTEVHAAFLSFAYNVGEAGAENSTAAARMQKGDLAGAAEALEWWNKSGGQVLKGLKRRRRAEGLVLLGATAESAISSAEKALP